MITVNGRPFQEFVAYTGKREGGIKRSGPVQRAIQVHHTDNLRRLFQGAPVVEWTSTRDLRVRLWPDADPSNFRRALDILWREGVLDRCHKRVPTGQVGLYWKVST